MAGAVVRTCLDCGEDISHRRGNAKRCEQHAKDRAKKLDIAPKIRWQNANKKRHAATTKLWAEANKERKRRTNLLWRQANKERIKRVDGKWKAENRAKTRAWTRRWREQNPGASSASSGRWAKAHPEYMRARAQARRAMKLDQLGCVSGDIEQIILKRQGNRCAAPWCMKELLARSDWHLDHIMPLSLGGLHGDSNLQILCCNCNCSKNAQHPNEWQTQHGRLPL